MGNAENGTSARSGRTGGEFRQIGTHLLRRNRRDASPSLIKRGWPGRDWPAFTSGNSESGTVLYSPEIIEDDVQVGLGGRRAVGVRVNDPSTNLDGGLGAEIGGGLEKDH